MCQKLENTNVTCISFDLCDQTIMTVFLFFTVIYDLIFSSNVLIHDFLVLVMKDFTDFESYHCIVKNPKKSDIKIKNTVKEFVLGLISQTSIQGDAL